MRPGEKRSALPAGSLASRPAVWNVAPAGGRPMFRRAISGLRPEIELPAPIGAPVAFRAHALSHLLGETVVVAHLDDDRHREGVAGEQHLLLRLEVVDQDLQR